MFEKIKAWIKRKRETAREQQAADRLIKHIEQALGFELYEWQRLRARLKQAATRASARAARYITQRLWQIA